MECRFCTKSIVNVFLDLGSTAISNAYLTKAQLLHPESIYSLKVMVCDNCFLVQVDEVQKKEDIFNENYAYFSSISSSWLEHCKRYCESIVKKLKLNANSNVVEIASNDGYLLQYFKKGGIPCYGIEPSASSAKLATEKGIDTVVEFFTEDLARSLSGDGKSADLIIGNNVLAHVPNLNDFVRGLKLLLKPGGSMTFEFPHLTKLVQHKEFDTIYHEHFSYFSLYTADKIFSHHAFDVYDVDELETHGGSLRLYVKHKDDDSREITSAVKDLIKQELELGVDALPFYVGFQDIVNENKNAFLRYLLEQKAKKKKIAAFGAAAKGNTYLNYCGIKPDLIEFVADDTPLKQGKYLPQSHIPIVSQDVLKEEKPDVIIILPWNFKREISEKLAYSKKWGAELVTYIPELEVF